MTFPLVISRLVVSQPKRRWATLPTRVLANIFKHVVPDTPDGSDQEDDASGPVRLLTSIETSLRTLCLVCSRWRRIVEDTPVLWSTIVIIAGGGLTNNQIGRQHTYLAIVRRHLYRSCSAPLRICIVKGRKDLPSESEAESDFNKSVKLVKEHSDRWKSLRVYGVHGSRALRAILPSQLPQLVEATFRNVTTGTDTFPMPISYTPKLRTLSTTSDRGLSYFVAMNGCEALRRCTISEPQGAAHWEELRIFLSSNAQNVELLEIRSPHPRAPGTEPLLLEHAAASSKSNDPEGFELLYLRGLILTGTTGHGWLLSRLSAPSIQYLIFDGVRLPLRRAWGSTSIYQDLICGGHGGYSTTESLVTCAERLGSGVARQKRASRRKGGGSTTSATAARRYIM